MERVDNIQLFITSSLFDEQRTKQNCVQENLTDRSDELLRKYVQL